MSNHESKGAAGSGRESIFVLPKWLIGLTTGVLGVAGYALIDWLTPPTLETKIQVRLLLLTLAGVILLFLCCGLFCFRFWQRTRKKVRFGILWNAEKQPICPTCDSPLSVKNEYSFMCSPCDIRIEPHDESGRYLSPREAIARVKNLPIQTADYRKENEQLRGKLKILELENQSQASELEQYRDAGDGFA